MEITVGQWCRDNKNRIAKILSDNLYGKGTFKHRKFKMSNGILITYADKITKTASTPQELVDCDDLIAFKTGNKYIVIKAYFDNHTQQTIVVTASGWNFKKDITAIYTPNADKSVYTLQWRAE